MQPLLLAHAPNWFERVPRCAGRGVARSAAGLATMASELLHVLEALSETVPLVLVLEDLQWSDRETLAVLHSLAGRPASARVLVVLTYAPISPRQVPVEDFVNLSRTCTIRLSPPTDRQIETYLAAMFGYGHLRAVASAPDSPFRDLVAGSHGISRFGSVPGALVRKSRRRHWSAA